MGTRRCFHRRRSRSRPRPRTSKAATAPKASAPTQANPAASVQGVPPPVTAEAVTPSVPAREIEVDNADVHAVFTTRGAVLKSWKLKKYRDSSNQPLEMIAGHAPADSLLPFTLAVDDAALSAKLAAAAVHCGAVHGVERRRMAGAVRLPGRGGRARAENLHDRAGQAVRHQRDGVGLGERAARSRARSVGAPRSGAASRRGRPRHTTRRRSRSSSRTARSRGLRPTRSRSSRFRTGRSVSPASTITTSSRRW